MLIHHGKSSRSISLRLGMAAFIAMLSIGLLSIDQNLRAQTAGNTDAVVLRLKGFGFGTLRITLVLCLMYRVM